MAEQIIKSEVAGSTGSSVRFTCADCKAWAWEGQRIRHSSRCDTPNVQPGIESSPVIKEPSPFALQPSEDIYDRNYRLVKQGHMTQSDAMNTDY